jgi:hypothetical protein
VRANARGYLSPPFKGTSFQGIGKLADSLPTWFEIAKDPVQDLPLAAMLMEKAGTGGALFRKLYRDFLGEAGEHVGASPKLVQARAAFAASATEWSAVASRLNEAARKAEAAPLRDAAARCRRIADLETAAMRQLVTL